MLHNNENERILIVKAKVEERMEYLKKQKEVITENETRLDQSEWKIKQLKEKLNERENLSKNRVSQSHFLANKKTEIKNEDNIEKKSICICM